VEIERPRQVRLLTPYLQVGRAEVDAGFRTEKTKAQVLKLENQMSEDSQGDKLYYKLY